jgi:signal transduction histidine kinase
LSVRSRLVLTFATVVALLIVPALFAARGLSNLRNLAIEGREGHAQAALAMGHLKARLAELDFAVRAYVASPNAIRREATLGHVTRLESEVSRIQTAGYLDAAPPLWDELANVWVQVATIDSLMRAGEIAAATTFVTTAYDRASSETRARIDEVRVGIDARAQGDFDRARAIGVASLRLTLLAAIATIIASLLLSVWTTRHLTEPLRKLRTALANVGDGVFELPEDLPYRRNDEIGELARSFGTMSRRLAELSRLRAEFLGIASHELKTPINVIRSYGELVEEELGGDITAHQREMMKRIGEQTGVLTRQVSRLMDISRLETGKYTLEAERIKLTDLIMGVERAFEVVAMEKGVALETAVHAGAPEWLTVDVDLMRDDVLSNLVANAIKFTPAGGRVTVSARGEGGRIVIELSDTGPGIPAEHRPHIFEKYYQAERSRSIGSGLGLAIAKDMVEAHAGAIELVDQDGPGATFRVYLPADAEVPTARIGLSAGV